MPNNSLAPSFIKLFYTSNGHEHIMTIPVLAYLGIGDIWFLQEKASSVGRAWTVSFPEFITAMRPAFPPSDTFVSAELWTMASPTADPIFREAQALGTLGTGSGTDLANGQASMTYRSSTGGLYRLILLEGLFPVNLKDAPPFVAPFLAIDTYVRATTSVIFARDGGNLIAAIRLLTKTNDTLRKKFLLDA